MLFFTKTALANYLIAIYNLNPLFEFDGYYILMDALDKPNLRSHATNWLWNIRKFQKKYLPELGYWIASILFILTSSLIAYLIQNEIMIQVLPEKARSFFSSYLKWLFFVFVLLFSFINLYSRSKKSVMKGPRENPA